MSLDRTALARALARHGPVVRVVVAKVEGSAPREVGADMLVWPAGQSGTIGGGTLEFEAATTARDMLARGEARALQTALLGPDLGQCCGGAVTLLFEAWTTESLETLGDGLHARPVAGDPPEAPPLAVARLLARARGAGMPVAPRLVDGWFVEPVTHPRASVWIWGAGHVGRALVATLAPHPDLEITWLDTAPERFPEGLPDGVIVRPAPDLAACVHEAPATAHHIVLTYSHALDFALCDSLLRHGFLTAGLIGSKTKWARFRTRLKQNGHLSDAIARIRCPIGDPSLGKHPQAIAVGVASALLRDVAQAQEDRAAPGDEGTRDDRRALDA